MLKRDRREVWQLMADGSLPPAARSRRAAGKSLTGYLWGIEGRVSRTHRIVPERPETSAGASCRRRPPPPLFPYLIPPAIPPTVSSACSTRSDQNAAFSRMQFRNRSPLENRVPGARLIPFFNALS